MWFGQAAMAGVFGTLACAATAVPAVAADAGWHLERVVVVMRHGVRPPTRPVALRPGMAPAAWPVWSVGWGELTPHGAQAVAQVAVFDRQAYGGLIGAGCPAAGTVSVGADSDQRTIATAEAYVAAMFPGCTVGVTHQPLGTTDPLWSPGEGGVPLLPPGMARAAAMAALPKGGVRALDAALAPQWRRIDRILGCRIAACSIAAQPTTVDESAAGRVRLGGALPMAASFAETLALEYADGKPLAEVGWGRADRATITALLTLHAQAFALTARAGPVARAGAGALIGVVRAALTAVDGPRFTLLVGHDTNLAMMGGALGLHWHAAQFAAYDPPPGGALMFERWRHASGRVRLVVRFRSQTLDEMRTLTPPRVGASRVLAAPGCGGTRGCDAAAFGEALSVPGTPAPAR